MPLDLTPDTPEAFLCVVMARSADATTETIAALADEFGALRGRTEAYDFDMTSYYEAEMGSGLCKALAWFGPLVEPAELVQRKQATIAFERARSGADQRRTVNVDPGLLSVDSLVLATTKASGHRICMAPGLWAEVTLRFEKGAYRRQPWTYLDYQREDVGAFLLSVRATLLG